MNMWDAFEGGSFSFDSIAWDVNKAIPLMYPDGISIEDLGYPGFCTDAIEVYGISWGVQTNFRSHGNMTREEMTLVLYRMSGEKATTNVSYSDIGTLRAESQEAIKALTSKDAITGYLDGIFRPLASITRAEAIVIINRFFKDAVVDSNSSFNPTDVEGHWAEDQVRKVLKDTEVRDTSNDIDWSKATEDKA